MAFCGKRLTPSVEFSNTDKELIDYWKSQYPYFREYSQYPSQRKNDKGHRIRYKLMLRKLEDVEKFLIEIKDSLISSRKKKLAVLLLEFVNLRKNSLRAKGSNPHKPRAWTYSQREYKIYVEMQLLNLKGRRRKKAIEVQKMLDEGKLGLGD